MGSALHRLPTGSRRLLFGERSLLWSLVYVLCILYLQGRCYEWLVPRSGWGLAMYLQDKCGTRLAA